MKVYFFPKTILGKWSVWLIVAFVWLILAFQLLVALGQQGGQTFMDNLLLTTPIFLAGICGISSCITGLIGIIKSKERAILAFCATLIGLFVLVFLLASL